MPTAPPLAFLIHASAKQVRETKLPLTQATSIMKGTLLPLVRAEASVLLKPVVLQEVFEP